MTKIYFLTMGCSTNQAESEAMAGLLKAAGFEITRKKEDADVIVLNTCVVKGTQGALKNINEINESLGENQGLIIAGCLNKKAYKEYREIVPEASFINTDNIHNIKDVVEETLNGNSVTLMSTEEEVKLGFPRVRKNPYVAIIPICNSCVSNCAYCIVKSIKGKHLSYPKETIIKEIREALKEGVKEIWLTAQDTASYGMDSGKSQLPELVKEILQINSQFMLRIGMMNPANLMPILYDMVEVYKDPRVFKFLHIPIQSGNNEVLEKMKREYVAEDVLFIVNKFKESYPNISIATDVICGFPGETESQFFETVDFVRELFPAVINISRYQDIPGTASYKMDKELKVPGDAIKGRSKFITDVFINISKMNNEKWMDWEGTVIIDDKKEDWIGRNFAYKPIAIKSGGDLLGKVLKVKIVDHTPTSLIGTIIQMSK
ncbi:tRNA (N(6)-L-threonylcarbamoyladenosine(37)-C(2))-methylthiotransferase [Candidatus Woesearchaeota archaeon]|nr:tRNA (N(6)-L-threonylcarbamoyladenosine(37)-C(2))-methylthiotransferase [Candidatus Woesearchaeota archaeon]